MDFSNHFLSMLFQMLLIDPHDAFSLAFHSYFLHLVPLQPESTSLFLLLTSVYMTARLIFPKCNSCYETPVQMPLLTSLHLLSEEQTDYSCINGPLWYGFLPFSWMKSALIFPGQF